MAQNPIGLIETLIEETLIDASVWHGTNKALTRLKATYRQRADNVQSTYTL